MNKATFCYCKSRIEDCPLESRENGRAKRNPVRTAVLRVAFVQAYLRNKNIRLNSKEEEATLLHEVRAFTLASHFLWGLWSVVNATISQIPFGYWEYAEARLNAYSELKKQLLQNEVGGIKRKTEEVD